MDSVIVATNVKTAPPPERNPSTAATGQVENQTAHQIQQQSGFPDPTGALSSAHLVTPDRSPSKRLVPGLHPEPDFYAQHLEEMMQTVNRWLGTRTQAPAAVLARTVLLLSVNARRLLVRILNRRPGPLRVETLDYPEVSDTLAALRELEAAGLLERQPMLSGSRQLALLRKDELLNFFSQELQGCRRQRKPVLLDAVIKCCSDTLIYERLTAQLQWVALSRHDDFQLLSLLYFGDQHGSLTQFVTEALGIVTYPAVALSLPRTLSEIAPVDREGPIEDPVTAALEALRGLSIQCALSHRMSSALKGQRKAPQPQRSASVASAWRLAAALLAQPPEALLDSRRRRALLRLGQGFERARAWWPALRCFCASGLPPATERRLRMLWRLGQQPAARAIAYQLLTPEQRALDRAFGQSLLRHGIRRRNSRSSEVRVSLLETPNRRPIEQQALELLLNAVATTSESGPARGDDPQPAAQPPIGWHCENLFSLGLAGLIYWPIIYAPIKGAFTRRFQSRPHGFGEPGFLQERQPQLAALERQWLRNGEPLAGCAEALTDHLLAQQQNNAGILNPLVSWQFWTAERLVRLLRQVDPLQLLKLARFTIHNLTDYRTGFPDLVICSGDGSFFCVEVKGPNDTLQPMQRQWLQALRTLDIEAFVLKVESSGRL